MPNSELQGSTACNCIKPKKLFGSGAIKCFFLDFPSQERVNDTFKLCRNLFQVSNYPHGTLKPELKILSPYKNSNLNHIESHSSSQCKHTRQRGTDKRK